MDDLSVLNCDDRNQPIVIAYSIPENLAVHVVLNDHDTMILRAMHNKSVAGAKLDRLAVTGEASHQIGAPSNLLREQTRPGRLISPAFLLTRTKKYYLTIEYNDQSREAHSVIVRLNKRNARRAVAAATAETSKSVEQIEEK